ncbi:Transglutaminase-like protein [Metarhizium album ARSEF 1941]|uniref:Transglutaminase-like protein n=1 Tax=Metarhizium album (strain ARSEF 1941) TaxID=1081103 RepID=A0A0B2WRB7_METAS|nr:Transglutaminase-like protein [Metarhizium album ARSEF 1941]KHN96042.1 Transglutaminase-like protein [Metarhizium album ARSEF 1941]
MADAEEPQFSTIAERIAALNKQRNFNGNGNGNGNGTAEPTRKRPPPAPPVRPTSPKRSETSPAALSTAASAHSYPSIPSRPVKGNAPPPLPRRDTQSPVASNDSLATKAVKGPPPLPSRPTSSQTPPKLPWRASAQPTAYLSPRRNSASSEISQHSTVSTSSLGRTTSSNTSYAPSGNAPRKMMAPATCNPADLPPLPPSKRELEAQAKEATTQEIAVKDMAAREYRAKQALKAQEGRPVSNTPSPTPPTRPGLPPQLPSRPAPAQTNSVVVVEETEQAPRKLPIGTIRGFSSGKTVKAPLPPTRRPQLPPRSSADAETIRDEPPPPVPLSSRPSAAQIREASSEVAMRASNGETKGRSTTECWVCRDWSGPDTVAAQFPRQSLPRNDPVGHLAHGLCDPFPSYDDKARAIFTWCHHNISYDTASFFGNNVKPMSVEDTIFSGLAVCQGYADTFKAVANRAGLECVVVGGHGKGFGHKPLKQGERPPPAKPDGHAWNAVRVDGGSWKLIDACWGAGHICSATNLYKKEFSPREFTLTNEKFGLRHFPRDFLLQHRSDGRTVSWEEYYTGGMDGEPHQWYGTGNNEGIAEDSVEPKCRDISVYSGQVVRFQFSRVCEHWTSEKAGLGSPALFLLSIHGLDGRKEEIIPTETNGYWNWVDVDARDLGAPGQSVEILKLETMDNRDARGVTPEEFKSKRGRVGMSWSYIARWNLV